MIMTLSEIHTATLNSTIVKEALKQAEQRLTDVLEIKKQLDGRVHMLLTSYVTMSLFLSGIAGTLYKNSGQSALFLAFIITSITFIIGAAVLLFTLKAANYGVLGSAPEGWLRREVLEGDDNGLTTMLAYEVYHYQERITVSQNSNNLKACLLNIAILLGVAAPVLLTFFMVFN